MAQLVVCLSSMRNLWVPHPALSKQGTGPHVYNPIALEEEAEAPEIEGHPWLHGELQNGTGHIRPCPIERKRQKRE